MSPSVGNVIKELSDTMARINRKIEKIDSQDKRNYDSEMEDLNQIKSQLNRVKNTERNGSGNGS